jgi:hypothetical protein
MKAVLRGLRDYNVNSYTVTLKSNEKKYCVVTISAKDYYTLQSESELMLIVDGMEIFTGIINKINFDYLNNKYNITLDELAYKLAVDYDLLKDAVDYDVSYTSATSTTILTDILTDTSFTVGYVPAQTIALIEGNKLNRYEWLRLLADNCVCGLDVNGKYTTDSANIVSEQTACDVWTVGNEIFIGVNGCTRSNKTSHVWSKKTCDITNAIIDIPEIEINVNPTQKVIVIGKDGIIGEASVGTSPTIVITDDSCADAAACEKRAKDELSKQNKLASLTINVEPDLFYSKVIELGCHVTISEPAFIAGTYEIIEMEITQEKCSITLDRPKKRLETILDDLKRRVNLIERWR